MANYQGFETKDGGVLESVSAMCRHLTTGGQFREDSTVPLADVERYIDDSYYWLLGELARNGYAVTQTDTEVKGALQSIQAMDAAVQVEFSVPTTAAGEENTRYRSLIARRDRLVRTLLETEALERLGATRDVAKSEYLEGTGRSVDRKREVYTSSDVVQPRFPRGFGKRKDVPERTGTETTHLADPSQA